MKKTIVYSASLLSLLVLIQSCVKDVQSYVERPAQPDQYLNVNVSSGQNYVFTAGTSGNLSVMTQAAHYLVSQTGYSDNGSSVYNYSSSPGYMGEDNVVLLYSVNPTTPEDHASGCSQSGNQNSQSTTMIAIKINVTK